MLRQSVEGQPPGRLPAERRTCCRHRFEALSDNPAPSGGPRRETVRVSLIRKASCKVGLHSGSWSLPDQQCRSYRVCDGCSKRSDKVIHAWTEFTYLRASACGQTRACARCGTTETRTNHAWGPWQYHGPSTCDQFRTCLRCHSLERNSLQAHSFTAWTYESAGDCAQVLHCRRCGKRGAETRTEHQWSEYQYSERTGGVVRCCTRCGSVPVSIGGLHGIRRYPGP
jgi:hypothetical protein